MNLAEFRLSLAMERPPEGLSLPAQALWWQAKGEWQKAHRCAQQAGNAEGAWVHAHLHRVEGDLSNAGGWYRRAGHPVSTLSLDEEWEAIAKDLIAKSLLGG
jgi:hypothetical protein